MVGKFQVMATLQAARAKALGYSEEEAKSFGLNRAIFYAAAKRGFKGGSQKKPGKKMTMKISPLERKKKVLDMEAVGNESAYAVHMNGKRYFVMGDDILDEKDFERQIQRPFGETFDIAWHEALTLVEHTPREVLESQRKFYEEVYKPLRDELAAKWSKREKKI
jgi:hypothetical protein